VPGLVGLDGVLGEVLGAGGVVADGGGVGDVVDGGEADGERSPGRSPTRSVGDSLQAVSRPAPSATAQRPASILFMWKSPLVGVARHAEVLQRRCRPVA
jgi:hypothetical protein